MNNIKNNWLIWSNEHKAWWNANKRGYTFIIEEAGRYSFDDANLLCNEANEYLQSDEMPNEIMSPSPELMDQINRNEY